MDELIADFVAETNASLAQIETDFALLSSEGVEGEALLRIVRALHTLKGTCGFLKFARTAALAHACEGALIRWRAGRAAPETREIVEAALAQIKDVIGAIAQDGAEPEDDDSALLTALAAMPNALDWAVELAAIRDRLLARASQAIGAHFPKPPAPAVCAPATAPVDAAWRTLPLLVEELAHALAKPMALHIEGGGVEVPGEAIAPLRDALGHLIRNCADHGIEPPEERAARGKPEKGEIKLSAARDGDRILVRLGDDGRGLDTGRIRSRAISQGLVFASHAARMDADQIHAFIFAPGFSTTDCATALSGRGIGLDAVRAAIARLGGAVALHSEPGAGTVFTLTIPAEAARAPQARPEPPLAALDVANVA